MLTPQEVQDKKFKQAFVGGYDMATVDEFLEILTQDYTALFKENAVLKNKMKVLVGKVEEYRSNDDNIRQAYLAIKRQAEQELESARAEAVRIMEAASGEAAAHKAKILEQIELEQKRLETAQEQTVTFVGALRELYSNQMDKLAFIPQMEFAPSPSQKRETVMRDTAREIQARVTLLTAEEEEPSGEPSDEETTQTFLLEGEEAAGQAPDIREDQPEAFEVKFPPGVLGEYDEFADPEDDTVAPGPSFNFAGLEAQFGHEVPPPKKGAAK